MKLLKKAITVAGLTLLSTAAHAGEQSMGDPFEKNGMEIGGVYLQAVKMAPSMPNMGQGEVHIEADISALKGANSGFGEGDWIPYLTVTYKVEKLGSDWSSFGTFRPMVASDGPHYGENITMDGIGKYRATYVISPPPRAGFMRHTDKETGVGKWWEPFIVSWDFTFAGAGKKGSY